MTFKIIRLKFVTALLAASALSACGHKNGDPTPAGPEAPVSNGTGSLGGGGNGIDEKMLESFAISIDTLPEYRRYIEPLIRKIGRGRGDILTTYMQWGIKQKIWYMIPRPLADLSRDQVGTGFSTDQYALNNDARVYIAKATYLKMDHKERANLLMHEIVMSARLLMKKSPKEQCEKLAGAQLSNCSDPDMMKLAEAIDVSEGDRGKMDTPDHDAVRAMTIFLMQHPDEVSAASVTAKRRELGFVFPWDKAVSNVTASDVRLAIQRSALAGETFSANSNIRNFSQSTATSCKLKLQSFSDDASSLELQAVVAQEFPYDFRGTLPPDWSPAYLRPIDYSLPNSNQLATLEEANVSIYDESFEAQGVVDPSNNRRVVDRIRLRPLLQNENIPSYIHQNPPLNFNQVEIFLTRDTNPQIARISVRKLSLHYIHENPDERAITNEDWEFVVNQREQFRCTPVAPTNSNAKIN